MGFLVVEGLSTRLVAVADEPGVGEESGRHGDLGGRQSLSSGRQQSQRMLMGLFVWWRVSAMAQRSSPEAAANEGSGSRGDLGDRRFPSWDDEGGLR